LKGAGLNILLFCLTFMTVLITGALMQGADPFMYPFSLTEGLPFTLALMSILLCHELSHYFSSRRHGVDATLPYFIPVPPLPGVISIGTFGAFIKMRSPIFSRGALIDIGASGPIVGFAVAVAASVIGLMQSNITKLEEGMQVLTLGESALFSALSYLIIGPVPEGYDVYLHPVAFAGWIGFFITSLNLIPIGQLDGGHILYAIVGAKHRLLSKVLVVVLGVLGMFTWMGWAFWAVLMLLLGINHPPVVYWEYPLDQGRRATAIAALVIFLLTFTPLPFTVAL
jgi:membrane-associated protease RseP (regulator of RpoE activity)